MELLTVALMDSIGSTSFGVIHWSSKKIDAYEKSWRKSQEVSAKVVHFMCISASTGHKFYLHSWYLIKTLKGLSNILRPAVIFSTHLEKKAIKAMDLSPLNLILQVTPSPVHQVNRSQLQMTSANRGAEDCRISMVFGCLYSCLQPSWLGCSRVNTNINGGFLA